VTCRVTVTPNAEAELRAAYRYIRKQAPDAALAWVKGARQRLRSLAQHPERAARAPESISFEEPIREVFYGSGNRGTYRILFTVIGQDVYVLHFRHGSMLPVEPE
jgi:plasmid stabilization system protein ParE